MRGILAVGAAVAATALVGQVAKATLSFSLVQVPISAAAKTADPTLNNARSFELAVTQTGEQFAVADLQMTLGTGANLSGHLYAPTGHSDKPAGSLATGTLANLAYDTVFTTPQYGIGSLAGTSTVTDPTGVSGSPTIDIVGGSDFPVSPAPASAITAGTGTNTLNISWGDHRADIANVANGTYPIAMITVTGNTGAYLNGYLEGTTTTAPVIFHNLYLPISGDTDGDGVVGLSDLSNLVNHLGGPGANGGDITHGNNGDIDGDNVVGLSDLSLLVNNLGNSLAAPPGAALGTLVPEPTSLFAIGSAALMLAGKRRSRKH